jgi:hypothetical protein
MLNNIALKINRLKKINCCFYAFLLFLAIFMAGCVTTFSPDLAGISNKTWASYDQAKQRELAAAYQHTLYSGLPLANGSVPPAQGNYLRVQVSGGKAIMPPFESWYTYQPVAFYIASGTCVDTILRQEIAKNQIELRACYHDDTLFLDPSRYEANKVPGSISFHLNPLWEQGFIYHNINTSGYVWLKDAEVLIKEKGRNLLDLKSAS